MKASYFNRRNLLKMSAFASAETFLNFGGAASETSAKNQTAGSSGEKIVRLWRNENPYGASHKARQASAGAASLQEAAFVRKSHRKNAETKSSALAEMDNLKLFYAPISQNSFF